MHAPHIDKTNSYASFLSKSQSQVPLKVTPITILGSPSRLTALQMAPLSPYLTNIIETRGILEQQTRGMWPLKMASSCLASLRCVPQGWLHLGGVRTMLILCLFDSNGVVKKNKQADVRYQLCLLTAQLFNHGELHWWLHNMIRILMQVQGEAALVFFYKHNSRHYN